MAIPEGGPVATLRQLWQALLCVPEVRDNDHFFELGGHSMLASRLMSRARKALATPLPMRIVFDYPVFADFAAEVLAASSDGDAGRPEAVLHPMPRASGRASGPASLQQEQLMRVELALGPSALHNVCTVAEVGEAVDAGALRSALAALMARHPALRTALRQDRSGGVTAEVVPIGSCAPVELAEVDVGGLGAAADASIRRALRRQHLSAFDVGEGRFLRAQLFRRGSAPDLLALHSHHLAVDGGSLALLRDDLEAAYVVAVAGGTPCPGPELPGCTYVEYALWQRTQVDAVRSAMRTHWRGVVEALSAPGRGVPGLGTDASTSSPRSVLRRSRRVSPEVMASLRGWAAADGVTDFLALAVAVALARRELAGGSVSGVGTLLENRSMPEFETLVGPLATSTLLAVAVPAGRTPCQWLRDARQQLLTAQDGAGVPLELLVSDAVAEAAAGPGLVDLVLATERAEPRPTSLRGGLGLRPLSDDGEPLVPAMAGPVPSLFGFARPDGSLDLVLDGVGAPTGAEQFLAAVEAAIERLATHPDEPVV